MPTRDVRWRTENDVNDCAKSLPKPKLTKADTYRDDGYYLPWPCKLFPERVVEYPDFTELDESIQKKLKRWKLPGTREIRLRQKEWGATPWPPGEELYRSELSVAPGTKVGGYVAWIEFPDFPSCRCGTRMEHFLTIATGEDLFSRRWTPIEEAAALRRQHLDFERCLSMNHVAGLELGDGGSMYFFICRRCPTWPIQATLQCG